MLIDAPQYSLYLAGGAFVLGWVMAKFAANFGGRFKTRERDPRDNRIRSLEAEHRVARSDADRANAALEASGKELAATTETLQQREATIAEQLQMIGQLRIDLKDSVKKTRELRGELSDRATENVRSEVKLREVETELSVAHASTDLIVTGALDYSLVMEPDEDADAEDPVIRAATGE